jgi:hypothetical protein
MSSYEHHGDMQPLLQRFDFILQNIAGNRIQRAKRSSINRWRSGGERAKYAYALLHARPRVRWVFSRRTPHRACRPVPSSSWLCCGTFPCSFENLGTTLRYSSIRHIGKTDRFAE